jgi:hypothetical protein
VPVIASAPRLIAHIVEPVARCVKMVKSAPMANALYLAKKV